MEFRLPGLMQAIKRALSGARYALGADAKGSASVHARATDHRARSARRRGAALALSLAMLGALASVAAVAAASSTASGNAFVQAGNKLTAEGEATAGQLGTSAALSGDGRTLIVGARKDDGGSAYVFVRNNEPWPEASWSQTAKLTPGEVASGEGESTCTAGACPGEECAEEPSAGETAEECAFGASVAVSADGDTALVGDPSPGAAPGSAWVFTKAPDGSWSRTAVLVGDGSPHEGRFGRSVALSADGTTALVGDPSAANGNGEAFVFTREGTTWKRQAPLSGAQETTLAHLGRSVALSGDGTTALVGGPGADEAAGAVWVFTKSGASWAQQGSPLTMPGGAAGDHFGRSVALSSNGSTALVGAPDADGHRGAAATLVRSETGFAQLGPRIAEGLEEEGHFGASVALSGDASEALVGAPFTDLGAGTVTKLAGSPSGWAQASEGLGGTEAAGKGWRGMAVALSGDGMVAAIGAPRDDQRTGAAWVFERGPAASVPAPVVTAVTPGHGPTAGGTKVMIKGANFNDATEVHFGAKAVTVHPSSPTEIEAVTPPAAAGKVHVTVTTPTGVSAESRADTFLYEGPTTAPTPPPTGQQATSGTSTATGVGGSGGVLGFTAASAGTECRVSLAKTRLAVTRYRSVAIRLVRTGSGPCRGSLALVYRVRAKSRRFALRTIGTASFSIPSGKSRVVTLTLSRAGQRWLRAHHGNVGASLAIARIVPAPTVAQMASVRLSVKKARPASTVRR